MNQQPYLFGAATNRSYPLQDHLPEYHRGVVGSWLKENLPAGSWVLCPFGSSPQFALEAARSGYRVLLPVHNPILRFLLENLAAPPALESLNSALATLAASYKGKERLKPFLLSLYETECPLCGEKTTAASFTWSRSRGELLSKTCRCSACGEESDTDASLEDIKKAQEFSDRSPTYARALTRVTTPTDPIRPQVESALSSYPPRSVYALFTVLNKLTGFDLPADQLAAMQILLLHAFYRCSQPLALRVQPEEEADGQEDDTYQEENVWLAMEDALEIWPAKDRIVPLTTLPESPPDSGGICVFPGRVKDLIPQLGDLSIQGLTMVFPQPTPAFWGLSALWTGWLWGQEAAAPLRGILSAKTFDWPWISKAVESTLSELAEILAEPLPVLGLVPEATPPALISSTCSALVSELELISLALDPDQQLAQTHWKLIRSDRDHDPSLRDREQIRAAGYDLLQDAGEPQPNLVVYCAGITRLAQSGFPNQHTREGAEELYSRLMVNFEEIIAYRQGFLHYPQIDACWHLDLDLDPLPLSDRIERSLVTLLVLAGQPLPEEQLFQEIYQEFPALSTPRSGYLQACLRSYAERPEGDPHSWALKFSERPTKRLEDLAEMEEILRGIGTGLGFSTTAVPGPENITHLIWQDGKTVLDSFYLSASGLLNKIITGPKAGASRHWLAMPGSRAGLVHYKLGQNPPLADEIKENWGLVKFRHLRRLSQQGDLTRSNFLERFRLDPFTSDSPQLLLI